ncbi:DUF2793 domain-containing protein [Novosphingobium piscinae]|uniref:DUF2793 domain-containing protein n=1 Tax=Novosphingobium piscinae TaxID=1507448 RepID=A0A7X1G1G2_9SPHN|nr:DUF2793 domain-containing protein [Novosphingobium piscinae]MBC2670923.1 DUF2793 domain-containing protein [Novosphingobium piscinae]
MVDPLRLDGATARFALPLLFAGQAQKEVFVNQALAVLDGTLHCAIEGEAQTPPPNPVDGTAWLVGPAPTGDWTGCAGQIALRQGGQWLFVVPGDGFQLLDRSRRQVRHCIAGTWRAPDLPAPPSGGTVIDAEARQAWRALVAALQQWGVFPA